MLLEPVHMLEHEPDKTKGLNDHYGNKYNLNPRHHQQHQHQQHRHHSPFYPHNLKYKQKLMQKLLRKNLLVVIKDRLFAIIIINIIIIIIIFVPEILIATPYIYILVVNIMMYTGKVVPNTVTNKQYFLPK